MRNSFMLLWAVCAVTLHASPPPFNLRYHVHDVLHHADSIREAAPYGRMTDMSHGAEYAAAPAARDTLVAVAEVMEENIRKGRADESLFLNLSLVYVMTGETGLAEKTALKCGVMSHAALFLARASLVRGAVKRFLWYHDMADVSWGVKEYPDVAYDMMAWHEFYTDGRDCGAGMFLDLEKTAGGERKAVYAFRAARAYMRAGHSCEALAQLKRIIRQYPAYEDDARIMAGRCFSPSCGTPYDYIQIISPATRGARRHEAMMSVFHVWNAAGEYDRAKDMCMEMLEEIKEDSPLYDDVLCRMAEIHERERDTVMAKKVYEELLNRKECCTDEYFRVKKKYAALSPVGERTEDEKKRYGYVYSLYAAGDVSRAEEEIEKILAEGKCTDAYKPRYELLNAICRGRLYGCRAMIRYMRRVADVYEGTFQGNLAREVLKVYDNGTL